MQQLRANTCNIFYTSLTAGKTVIYYNSSKNADRNVSHERFACLIVKIIGLSINMIHIKLQYGHYEFDLSFIIIITSLESYRA
jgi:hypothetical protein